MVRAALSQKAYQQQSGSHVPPHPLRDPARYSHCERMIIRQKAGPDAFEDAFEGRNAP